MTFLGMPRADKLRSRRLVDLPSFLKYFFKNSVSLVAKEDSKETLPGAEIGQGKKQRGNSSTARKKKSREKSGHRRMSSAMQRGENEKKEQVSMSLV